MKRIKLIVFDLDGTFYDLNDIIASVYDCQLKFFCRERNISENEARENFTENGIFPYASSESKSCTEYFAGIGIDKTRWTAFRESNFDVTKIDRSKAVPPAVIRDFSTAYKSHLLSSNTFSSIQKVLRHLQIDMNAFADVICSDRFVSDNLFNKREAMAAIIQRSGFAPAECLSIGDRYNTDILPMLELGGSGVLVKTPCALGVLQKSLYSGNLETCEDFAYYESEH